MPILQLEMVDLEKPALDEYTLANAWDDWSAKGLSWSVKGDIELFVKFLAKRVHSLDDRNVVKCYADGKPMFDDEATTVGSPRCGDKVCQDCLDNNYA